MKKFHSIKFVANEGETERKTAIKEKERSIEAALRRCSTK